jgi:integration host factor subunit beta
MSPEQMETTVTKSELINLLAERYSHLAFRDVESAVKGMIDHMTQALSSGERIEIRGFGSFSLHYRPPRIGRNPKTGDAVQLSSKFVPHFKPGKELRDKVNQSREKQTMAASG